MVATDVHQQSLHHVNEIGAQTALLDNVQSRDYLGDYFDQSIGRDTLIALNQVSNQLLCLVCCRNYVQNLQTVLQEKLVVLATAADRLQEAEQCLRNMKIFALLCLLAFLALFLLADRQLNVLTAGDQSLHPAFCARLSLLLLVELHDLDMCQSHHVPSLNVLLAELHRVLQYVDDLEPFLQREVVLLL